ncbi:hypothetical protein Ndes2526B_g00575 [Nannochloris sp. 'desiccata']|nr:hypothetical protein KSW81_003880 [Chlorella desiccata (nom. nud.)]KAH7624383.1 hypothetical protein NADE_003735 [Chlorella desiccata (nom. nud.)]
MLHTLRCSIKSTLIKPLTYEIGFIPPKKQPKFLILCTAASQTASEPVTIATDDPSLSTEEPAPSTSPLYQPKFDAMYTQLSLWRAKYYTTIVPRNAHDAGDLGDWVASIRRLHRRGSLPTWAIERLNELDMTWKVDVLTAKWHANFHATREFKEVHGGEKCDLDTALPPDWGTKKKKNSVDHEQGTTESSSVVSDSEEVVRADWVEAARWLERQRELFTKEKLTDYRVWVLKRLLGIRLRREYAPRRKNMHPALLKQNAAFKRLVAKDETMNAAASAWVREAVAEEDKDIMGK